MRTARLGLLWCLVGSLSTISVIATSTLTAKAKTSPKNVPPFNASPLPGLLEMFLGLGIVLILAYLSIRFLGKKSQVRQRGSIDLIAARQIAPNKSVQVIGLQGKRFLIGVGDQITLLADVTADYDEPDELEQSSEGQAFGTLLSEALRSARVRYRTDGTKEDEQ